MTDHYFNHSLVRLHYYKFGNGPKAMLCFHGFGMHGKQFSILKEKFGNDYTFYGFDLFFHKETKLQNQSIEHLKKGISKTEFCKLIIDFCDAHQIDRFSVMSYSLGTYYATVLAEFEAKRIDKLFILAPAFLKTLPIIKVFAKNKFANLFFRKLFLSEHGISIALNLFRRIRIFDLKSYHILQKEMATAELRYAFYANVTYLRHLETKPSDLIKALNLNQVKCYFVFGERDKMYPQHLADEIIPQLNFGSKIILDEDHDMVNKNLPSKIYSLIYDN
ncbi:alpha/beta hydrolase [Pedobacter frigiditerrae]|uniref:alpha/beta fold hydrolase n=1 Tax=Pedobacter frigiditerrae TaxID=2530452 RepID=UPI00292D72B2|nr:alpha/beta hydrolase [Pedobacter frigiditerrae]